MSRINSENASMKQIVLATGNQGKVSEMSDLLAPLEIELISQSVYEMPECVEDGLSFIENAIKKARHASKYSGLAAIADDSGLAVNALQGRPGIYSARYAGEHGNDQDNINKLLLDMQHQTNRAAQFHCAIAFVRHCDDPTPLVIHKYWPGFILTEPQGEGGFGYDPIFLAPEFGCAAAELSKAQKSSVSHRGQAVKAFVEYLQAAKEKTQSQA